MTLIQLLITLVLLGVGLMLINTIDMDVKVKKIINVVFILVVIVWLLQTLNLLGPINSIKVN